MIAAPIRAIVVMLLAGLVPRVHLQNERVPNALVPLDLEVLPYVLIGTLADVLINKMIARSIVSTFATLS